MKKHMKALAIFLFAIVSLTGVVPAQSTDTKPDAATLTQLGGIVSHLLDTIYVSPEIGSRLARQLQEKLAAGGYADAATHTQLAEMLTSDLREWANDRHLYVKHQPESGGEEAILTVEQWERERPSHFAGGGMMRRRVVASGAGGAPPDDGGFEAKMLDGGVGYVKVDLFAGSPAARTKAAEAMRKLVGSKAIIVDVRSCPGGSAELVSFLASYFFDEKPRALMNRYSRPTGEHVQSTTVADVPGKRMPDTDLYILTSARTASAGESFAFTLQQYGRAKIVGEKTAGAGYNNAVLPLGKGFVFSISYARPEHPLTGKGWEAVGVQPDVKVAADDALETARKLAAGG